MLHKSWFKDAAADYSLLFGPDETHECDIASTQDGGARHIQSHITDENDEQEGSKNRALGNTRTDEPGAGRFAIQDDPHWAVS